MNVRNRLFQSLVLFVLMFFVLPISLRMASFAFEYQAANAHAHELETADMSSTGLLPPAEKHPAARIVVMSVPLSGHRGKFLTHTWIVFKLAGASSWCRYEVLGFASRDAEGKLNGQWVGNRPTLNRYAPDGRWFGRSPTVIADVSGTMAAAMIPRIETAIENYEATAGHYRVWPGPNSNTFVATVLRAVPELGASLPPTAIGKDFRPGFFTGFTGSRTGVEVDIWGVLGVKVGWIEGIEINLFSIVAGLDLRRPALKLPGFGLIDLTTDPSGPVVTSGNERRERPTSWIRLALP
jgi:hypothetical protein